VTRSLEGRVAAVTGGGRGIGAAIAARLAREGARVAIGDVLAGSAQAQAEAAGEAALGAGLDVTDAGSVAAFFATVADRLGTVDILVNNAAVAGPIAPFAEYPDDAFDRVFDVNVTGVFRCCKAVVPAMVEAGHGRIVNVASVSGKEGLPIMMAAYGASKAAVIALTKNLGRELAGTGVLVNCVIPAGIPTTGFMDWGSVPSRVVEASPPIPLGRWCDPGEIAAMVAWLASDECSFSTGAAFDISGGRTTY
jgi:2-dehydro-3-deoxy-L-rhamnonate dehydrogenase (NAD+)